MIDKAKFSAEIERRKGILENVNTSNSEVTHFYEGKAKAYKEVLDLLDYTQEEPEEHVCEDLGKEVNRYFWKEICNNKDIRLHYDYLFLIAKHFVLWQKEQMMKDAVDVEVKVEQKPAIKLERDENGEPVLNPFESELFSMMSDAWQGYMSGEEVNIAKIVKEHSIELLERANEHKPAWSEEDERLKQDIENLIHFALRDGSAVSPAAETTKEDAINWLKTLKDRVGCEADCTTTKDWSGESNVIMKANAPEKIYLHPDIGGREFIRPWLKRRVNQESIEYTRTDAFIEKVCEWLKDCATFTDMNGKKRIDEEMYKATVEDFKTYMEGE